MKNKNNANLHLSHNYQPRCTSLSLLARKGVLLGLRYCLGLDWMLSLLLSCIHSLVEDAIPVLECTSFRLSLQFSTWELMLFVRIQSPRLYKVATAHTASFKVELCARVPSLTDHLPQKNIHYASKA